MKIWTSGMKKMRQVFFWSPKLPEQVTSSLSMTLPLLGLNGTKARLIC